MAAPSALLRARRDDPSNDRTYTNLSCRRARNRGSYKNSIDRYRNVAPRIARRHWEGKPRPARGAEQSSEICSVSAAILFAYDELSSASALSSVFDDRYVDALRREFIRYAELALQTFDKISLSVFYRAVRKC